MNFFLAIVLSFISIQQISTQSFGQCIKSPVIKDFNATRYFGKWYEIKRFNYIFEPKNLQCLVANYGYLNQSAVSVYNFGLNM